MSAKKGDPKFKNGAGPRCELRETDNWNGKVGTHRMTLTTSVRMASSLIVAQIFNEDVNDPILFVKFDGVSTLYAFQNEAPKTKTVLDANFKINSDFTLTLSVVNGNVKIDFKGSSTSKSTSFKANAGNTNLYFKTGSYSQGDVSSSVRLTALSVSHS
jgi:hypothetical protein